MASPFGEVLSKLMVMAITTEHCFLNTSSKSLDHVHQFQMKNEKTPPPQKSIGLVTASGISASFIHREKVLEVDTRTFCRIQDVTQLLFPTKRWKVSTTYKNTHTHQKKYTERLNLQQGLTA